MTQNRKTRDGRDDRIITLLNQLGERMIRSEQSRRELEESVGKFDDLFSALEDRAANSEKYFLNMQRQISRADDIERTLRERQDKLEREQKSQAEKIERAAALTLKMEEALAQQARLARRLEKITQDRARMLHKLERIEEAVVETRESLNAKALVLLTEQAAAAQMAAPQLPAGIEKSKRRGERSAAAFFFPDRPVYRHAVAATVLAVFLLAGGWAVRTLYQERVLPAGADEKDMAAQISSAVDRYISPIGPAEGPEQAEEDGEEQVVLNMDDAALLNRFNEDPDSLAAALNELEPSVGTAVSGDMEEAAVEEKSAPVADTPLAKPEKVSFTGQDAKNVEPEQDAESFVRAQKDPRPLSERIERDESLPPVIAEIEAKAFDGIPEAQHDLAAIYTAGHGGVPVDYSRAARWFLEAALGGVANARYNLGVLYHQGMGVEKDVNRAVGWYRAAAKLNHPEAQYNLGIAYIEGIGAAYNAGKAAMNFEMAARGGIPEAAYNLGLILENGLLGTASPREALFWYKTAADRGSPEAKTAMENLARAMDIKTSEIDSLLDNPARPAVPSVPAPDKPAAGEKKSSGKTSSSSVKKEGGVAVLSSFPGISFPDRESPVTDARSAKIVEDGMTVAQIQEQLMRLNLYPGPADGIFGPKTEDAIRSYQKIAGLNRDGQPSELLLVHLLSAELAEPGGGVTAVEVGSRDQ